MNIRAAFTAPVGTDLTDYLCETGEAWTAHSGVGTINGNALQATAGILRATAPALACGTLRATVTALGLVSPAQVGLLMRYQDLNNHWYSSSYFDSGAGANRYQLRKIVAGVDGQAAAFSSGPTPAANDRLRAELTPAGVAFYVNDALLGTVEDTDLVTAALHGLYMPSGLGGAFGPKVDTFSFTPQVFVSEAGLNVIEARGGLSVIETRYGLEVAA